MKHTSIHVIFGENYLDMTYFRAHFGENFLDMTNFCAHFGELFSFLVLLKMALLVSFVHVMEVPLKLNINLFELDLVL